MADMGDAGAVGGKGLVYLFECGLNEVNWSWFWQFCGADVLQVRVGRDWGVEL